MNRKCHIFKGVETEWLASTRWFAKKHCDAANYTTEIRKSLTSLPPMQKARSLPELVPSTQIRKNQTPKNTSSADKRNNFNGKGQTNSNSNNKVPNNTNVNNTNNQKDRRTRPAYPPCETCCKTSHSTEKCYFGANAGNRSPPRNRRPGRQNQVQKRNAQSNSDVNVQAAAQNLNKRRYVFTPELHVTDRRQLKHQKYHQFPRFSGSNPRRPLQINLT